MKTSFYFVLWIIIYPILGWIGNDTVTNNLFIFALIGVIAISWPLHRSMKKHGMYEIETEVLQVLEDAYTGNVDSFGKRLSREMTIEAITAAYLIVTAVVTGIGILKTGLSGNSIVLAVCILFGLLWSIVRCVKMYKANSSLKSNHTPAQCVEIVNSTYNFNYEAYREAHTGVTFEYLLPLRPRHYKGFLVFSLVTAIIAALLGLLFIIASVIIFISGSLFIFGTAALSGMLVLYGFLAIYFGVKDTISTLQGLKRNPKTNNLYDNTL